MNTMELAQRAYAKPSATRTPQNIEYQAFARVTQRIRAAVEKGSSFAELAAALSENRKLWTLLAMDVADPKNALPSDLRAGIFYLAEFTEAETRKVLRKKADVSAIIEVNAAIMRGLRTQVEGK